MKRHFLPWLTILLILTSTAMASARELNIAGPWILEYPHGKGTLILTRMGDTYVGDLTIPRPQSGGSFVWKVRMLTHPSHVTPGFTVSFDTGSNVFLFLNLSSEVSGVGWINPGTENAELQSLFGVKVPAHR
ncbi:hypothetical protein [Thermanaerovibrio velox]|uniref:hypothetical protein n=1 Tax=Thermanaerovibrio velox TaxID=108007 RepID=UPI00059302AF|nr:hypothetical protein [Thermanaerovibrio velox]